MDYIARKSEDGREQLLIEHLKGVAKHAKDFASPFGMGEMAEFLGLLHDIGKYSTAFQDKIKNAPNRKIDHTTAGGQELLKHLPLDLLANCIFGHHGGLLNHGTRSDANHNNRSVSARKSKKKGEDLHLFEDYDAYKTELVFSSPQTEFFRSYQTFNPMPTSTPKQQSFTWQFLTRMLFSCLVDADFLDTEAFLKGDVGRSGHDNIDELLNRLNGELFKFTDTKGLNAYRNQILNNCIQRGKDAQGLYSLTVPTGGGKTLSSLAFALNHAKEHGLDRVIYVIPYTSIIEQNAGVFKKILEPQNVLENHSNAEYNNEEDSPTKYHYLANENWDIPVVVTTNVQFFESLFAHQTSRTRKLHNIANSVVIFDEAQMLPTEYLKPCMYAIQELVQNYKVTAVLCTATQPSLNLVEPKLLNIQPREICDNVAELYTALKRVNYKYLGVLNNAYLLEKLATHHQALCIVNSRKQAQDLFQGLAGGEGFYHLSTLMYPHHRKLVLEEIRKRLDDDLPVTLISTSLIEAGVDVDFEVVYRAKSGLDSIVQAGGRCNREGKRGLDSSWVYVFDTDKSEYDVPKALTLNLQATDDVIEKGHEIGSLESIKAYFDWLYTTKADSLDKKRDGEGFVDRLQKKNIQFEDISRDFKFIKDEGKRIFIPLGKDAESLLQQLHNLQHSPFGVSKQLYRQLGAHSVSVHSWEHETLNSAGVLEQVLGISVLNNLDAYSDKTGLLVTFENKPDGIFV